MVKTQFMHYRAPTKGWQKGIVGTEGGATVAIQIISDTQAVVGVSDCNPGDCFNKQLGRTIALGRIAAYLADKSKHRHVFEVDTLGAKTFKQAVHQVLVDDMESRGFF